MNSRTSMVDSYEITLFLAILLLTCLHLQRLRLCMLRLICYKMFQSLNKLFNETNTKKFVIFFFLKNILQQNKRNNYIK